MNDGQTLPPRSGSKRFLLWIFGLISLAGVSWGVHELDYSFRERQAREDENFKQIAIAFFDYLDDHNRFPPAAVYGDDGQPLLSWRVLLLPSLEQDALFKQFHLDEPWDSTHNIGLLDRMPDVYAPPWTERVEVPPNHTVLHVFVGQGTAFESPEGHHPSEFWDMPANTFLFVEAGPPTPWTKPESIAYSPDKPVHLRSLFRDGFRVCSATGHCTFVRHDAAVEQVRAAITRNGGERVPYPDDP